MYLRTTKRKKTDGSVVEYFQLAHNQRPTGGGAPVAKIIHSFGRSDQLDKNALSRLCHSIARVCGLSIDSNNETDKGGSGKAGLPKGVELVGSKFLGEVLVIEELWERLGIGKAIRKVECDSNLKIPHERALFAMTANRLCQPESKLGAYERWLPEVYLPSCKDLKQDHFYQAMDLFVKNAAEVEKSIFETTANLFNLEVDLIFYDTTTASFSIDKQNDDDGVDLRKFGHPKEGGWAPQVVVALAVTREGFPVRSWVFPGNTSDLKTVEKVKSDLRGWQLGRAMFVADAGMNSKGNRKELARAFGTYLLASRIGGLSEVEEQVLSKRGRFKAIAENLYAKEVIIGKGELRRRYFLCYNPKEAKRQRLHRADVIAQIKSELNSHNDHAATARWAVDLLASSRTRRYLQTTKDGKIKLNNEAVKKAERLDGKWVLQTNDDTISINDAAAGYKSLMVIERCFRTMKRAQINIMPVWHRLSQRIEAHVKICVLALLIERAAEHLTKKSWQNMHPILRRLQATRFKTDTHDFFERNAIDSELCELLKSLQIPVPKKILEVNPI